MFMAASQQPCGSRPRQYLTVIRPGLAPAQSVPVRSYSEGIQVSAPQPRPRRTMPQVARVVIQATFGFAEKTWLFGIVGFSLFCLFRMIIR
jgi:hypothetical protein